MKCSFLRVILLAPCVNRDFCPCGKKAAETAMVLARHGKWWIGV
nr:hypothetical protein [uncultured Cohaesibacter sp.]